MLLVAVTPWQPTLGLPRRRHSTKYPTEAKKLSIIGDLTEDKDAVYSAVSVFLCRCYGCVPQEDMAVVRSKVWFRRTATSAHATPKLQTLPPTETTLLPNILRAHYQTALWMSCENQDPPQASPTDFGWYRGEQGQMLPEMYSRGREPNIAPKELLKLIRFQCHATTDRCDGRCSCKLANIKCTAFCGCHDDGVFCVRYSSEDISDGRDDT